MNTRERFESVRQGRRNHFSLRTRLTILVTVEMLFCVLVAYGVDLLLNTVLELGWKVPLEIELVSACLLVGVLVTTAVETVTRKKINPKYEGYLHGAGMILLLILMGVIMLKDIWGLF